MCHYKVVTQGGEARLFTKKEEALHQAAWWAQFNYTQVCQGNYTDGYYTPIGKEFIIWEGEPEEEEATTTSLQIQRELDKLEIEPLESGLYLVTDNESVFRKFTSYEEAADFIDEIARRAEVYQSDYLWALVQDSPQFIDGVNPQEALEGWR